MSERGLTLSRYHLRHGPLSLKHLAETDLPRIHLRLGPISLTDLAERRALAECIGAPIERKHDTPTPSLRELAQARRAQRKR